MDFYETSGTSCPFSGQVFCLSRGYTFCLCKQLLSGCGSVCRLSANVASTVSCSLPTSQGSRYSATLPARRKRPIETHRCDSSVLCCLNSITQQIMMIMIEVLVPNNPGHVFIGLSSSPLGWKIFQPFKKNNKKNFLRDKQKNYLCLGLLLGNCSFIIHVVNKSMYI